MARDARASEMDLRSPRSSSKFEGGIGLRSFVVMFEHFHVLVGEPEIGTPSAVLQVLKQRVGRRLLPPRRKNQNQLGFWRQMESRRSVISFSLAFMTSTFTLAKR